MNTNNRNSQSTPLLKDAEKADAQAQYNNTQQKPVQDLHPQHHRFVVQPAAESQFNPNSHLPFVTSHLPVRCLPSLIQKYCQIASLQTPQISNITILETSSFPLRLLFGFLVLLGRPYLQPFITRVQWIPPPLPLSQHLVIIPRFPKRCLPIHVQ